MTWPLAASPATLWPPHHDARVFTWVMSSMARRLWTRPRTLFHGDAFYPHGESLAYSELLIPPGLLGTAGFLWGDPILTYNLLLLTLWPLNGVAMAWVAHALTGSRPAAWLAGGVFCLSPYFTEYYLEFQMLLAALLPVVLFAWTRWLETRTPRWLVIVAAGLVLQALTAWYYAIILSLGLAAAGAAVVCLRWRSGGWRRQLPVLALGGLGVAAILLPFAWPYLTVRREFGVERGLSETERHSADVLTFFERNGRSRFYQFDLSTKSTETSAFLGVAVPILALGSLVWLRRDPPLPKTAAWLTRGLVAALGFSLAASIWAIWRAMGGHPGGHIVGGGLGLALALGFGVLVVRGYVACRGPRRLTEGEWVRLLLLVTAVFAVLSLGPVIHVARRAVGPGPYLALYDVLFPLHVVRVATRFVVLSVAGMALLAALGLRVVDERLRSRPALRRVALAGIFVAVGLEFAVKPAVYEADSAAPRPVDRALRADPDDVAVLEWPLGLWRSDADAMFRSLAHGKRLINGLSGLVPRGVRQLSAVLSASGPAFATPEASAALRRIYPLRYVVVRLADPRLDDRSSWQATRANPPPLLRFVGTFGTEDLYEVVPLPESGTRLERWVSFDYLRHHPVLDVAVRPRAPRPDLDQWVDLLLNERLVRRIPLPAAETVRLAPPSRRARPNRIELQYGYARPAAAADERYEVGTTGVRLPGDLRVVSTGHPHLRADPHATGGSVQLNGAELSPRRRGYNLVALDASAQVLGARAFDTFFEVGAARELAAWIAALPTGTIVAGAVRDEASGQLTAEAVRALWTLGVVGDLRGRFREAHGFVGVKGAPPGAALERLGPFLVELAVGRVEWVAERREGRLGVELERFALHAR